MVRVGTDMWLAVPMTGGAETMLEEVNRRLSAGGLSISHEDARMLAEGRAEALADAERVEFGTPAIVEIARAVADSPCLSQPDATEVLAELQCAFYAVRNELPAEVPDEEIAGAMRGCLDAWGDAATVASMLAEEIMSFSEEDARASEVVGCGEYRITDDEGRVYVFDPDEWDYDEHADGWDGEGWADGWDD